MLRLAAIVALVSVLLGGVGGWRLHALKADAKLARLTEATHEAANEQYWTQRRRSERTDRETQSRIRAAAVAADGARSELEQLRAALAVGDDGAPALCTRIVERAATARRLFSECGGRYEAVARDAQRYADQLRGWQALNPEDTGPEGGHD